MKIEKFFLRHDKLYNFLVDTKLNIPYKYILGLLGGNNKNLNAKPLKRDVVIQIMGFKMKLKAGDMHDLYFYELYKSKQIYEPGITDYITKSLHKGNIFIDVGANNGYYSLLASKLVGNDGLVYAVEPDPNNFKKLKDNIKLNKSKNIIPLQIAASDYSGWANLNISEIENGLNSFVNIPSSKVKIKVKVEKLDNLIKKADIIKIDVEGYEKKVLLGARKLLNESIQRVIFEYNHSLIYYGDRDYNGAIDILRSNGFKLFQIHDTKPYINYNMEIKSNADLDTFFTNILAIKTKKQRN